MIEGSREWCEARIAELETTGRALIKRWHCHSGACVTYMPDGKSIVTPESCKCESEEKALRKVLGMFDASPSVSDECECPPEGHMLGCKRDRLEPLKQRASALKQRASANEARAEIAEHWASIYEQAPQRPSEARSPVDTAIRTLEYEAGMREQELADIRARLVSVESAAGFVVRRVGLAMNEKLRERIEVLRLALNSEADPSDWCSACKMGRHEECEGAPCVAARHRTNEAQVAHQKLEVAHQKLETARRRQALSDAAIHRSLRRISERMGLAKMYDHDPVGFVGVLESEVNNDKERIVGGCKAENEAARSGDSEVIGDEDREEQHDAHVLEDDDVCDGRLGSGGGPPSKAEGESKQDLVVEAGTGGRFGCCGAEPAYIRGRPVPHSHPQRPDNPRGVSAEQLSDVLEELTEACSPTDSRLTCVICGGRHWLDDEDGGDPDDGCVVVKAKALLLKPLRTETPEVKK